MVEVVFIYITEKEHLLTAAAASLRHLVVEISLQVRNIAVLKLLKLFNITWNLSFNIFQCSICRRKTREGVRG